MTRIETVFGAALVIVLLVIGAYAVTSGERGVRARTVTAEGPALGAVAITGDDLCGCYALAYDAAAGGQPAVGTVYEAGYGACRQASGRAGGQSWTVGWREAMEGEPFQRACKASRVER